MPSWLILGQDEGGGFGILTWIPLIIMWFFILWLFVTRPQKRAEARRRAELTALDKNDTVLTQGGVIGVVVQVKDDEVILRVDDKNNTRLRVKKSAVVGKYQAGADGAPEEPPKP